MSAEIVSTNSALVFAKDGAQLFRSALNKNDLESLETSISMLSADHAGIRLRGIPGLDQFLASSGAVGVVAAAVLGAWCQPVRAILFDKTASTNWALGWHQDRTIAVVKQVEVEGFGPWTVKEGITHVEPPFELLSGMVTLRVHIDAVSKANAPLLIARGSHKLGRIPVGDISQVVQRCDSYICTAGAGDIWLYATPILHASEVSAEPARRRVLHVDYAVGNLPGGLQWAGV